MAPDLFVSILVIHCIFTVALEVVVVVVLVFVVTVVVIVLFSAPLSLNIILLLFVSLCSFVSIFFIAGLIVSDKDNRIMDMEVDMEVGMKVDKVVGMKEDMKVGMDMEAGRIAFWPSPRRHHDR